VKSQINNYKYGWIQVIKGRQFINTLICDLTLEELCWLDCWSPFYKCNSFS